MRKTISGFTIVELLIVIVVIAILAAISIVAYNGIQQRARDSQRKSDLANAAKALGVRAIDKSYQVRANGACTTGTSIGWFSYADTGNKSAAQCLAEEAGGSTIFRDPSGQTSCTVSTGRTNCFAYLMCTDVAGNATYIAAHLETEAQSDTAMDTVPCAGAAWETSYGVNYFVRGPAFAS